MAMLARVVFTQKWRVVVSIFPVFLLMITSRAQVSRRTWKLRIVLFFLYSGLLVLSFSFAILVSKELGTNDRLDAFEVGRSQNRSNRVIKTVVSSEGSQRLPYWAATGLSVG